MLKPSYLSQCAAKLVLPFLVCGFVHQGQAALFEYATNNGAITITKFWSSYGTAVIPDAIDGLPVTAIGPSAFNGYLRETLTIPEGITNIGSFAFQSSLLTSIQLPSGSTEI